MTPQIGLSATESAEHGPAGVTGTPQPPQDGTAAHSATQSPGASAPALIRKDRAQLEAERDTLRARIAGCDDDTCPHHADDLAALDTVLWLLDEGDQ